MNLLSSIHSHSSKFNIFDYVTTTNITNPNFSAIRVGSTQTTVSANNYTLCSGYGTTSQQTDFIVGWTTTAGDSYGYGAINGINPWNTSLFPYPDGVSTAMFVQFYGSLLFGSKRIQQSIILNSGNYTVKFFAHPRNENSGYWSEQNQVTCSLNGASVTSSMSSAANWNNTIGWVPYSFNVTINSTGSYTLMFTFTNTSPSSTSTDSSISVTKVTLTKM